MRDLLVIRESAGHPGYYVSKCGRVFSIRQSLRIDHEYRWEMKELMASEEGAGYPCVTMTDGCGSVKTVRVHRMVCMTFNGPPRYADMEVRHLDGTRTNNHADNLKWGTRKENVADMIRHGRSNKDKLISHGGKLSHEDVHRIRDLYDSKWIGPTELARLYGISKNHAIKIGKRTMWGNLPQRGSVAARATWKSIGNKPGNEISS